MSIRIFELTEDKRLKITEHTLLIPELKALIDKYKKDNTIPVLSYVYLMTVPDSPYANLEEIEKEQEISADVGGDFSTDDILIDNAIAKLKRLYETPTTKALFASRKNLDTLIDDMENCTKITHGKDGNAEHMRWMQTNLAKLMDNFKKLEKMKAEEDKVAMRGKAQIGLY